MLPWLLALSSAGGTGASFGAVCGATTVPTQRPDSQYQLASPDGQEVTDKATGLVWARCSVGQQWKSGTCEGTAKIMTWHAAMKSAQAARTATAAWRVPTHRELLSLIDHECFGPAINVKWFPATMAANYWSATTSPEDMGGKAWAIDFFDGGYKGDGSQNGSSYVRFVRTVNGGAAIVGARGDLR